MFDRYERILIIFESIFSVYIMFTHEKDERSWIASEKSVKVRGASIMKQICFLRAQNSRLLRSALWLEASGSRSSTRIASLPCRKNKVEKIKTMKIDIVLPWLFSKLLFQLKKKGAMIKMYNLVIHTAPKSIIAKLWL